MRRRVWLSLVLAAAVVSVVAARRGVQLVAPHQTMPPAATLDRSLTELVARVPPVGTPEAAIDQALEVTGGRLHFGLGHVTSLRFDVAPRSGNCVEYAQLFAAVMKQIAQRDHLQLDVRIVRSDARMFGLRLPLASLRDHDWVLVRAPQERHTYFVDPSFDDAWLGWDVSGNVNAFAEKSRAPAQAK